MATEKEQMLPGMARGGDAMGPVECLGMTFPSDKARRAYFTQKLREKLGDPNFRRIEGFPNGEDEDILALSDPPFYTACPNPFIHHLIDEQSLASECVDRSVPAFADDLSGDKHSAVYNVHPYHTKVPPEAIAPLIRHYTQPGDVILDPFAGTGMTGVATDQVNREFCGEVPRKVVLNDISPMATFIASTYNSNSLYTQLNDILATTIDEVDRECGQMFRTAHTGWRANEKEEIHAVNRLSSTVDGTIIYTVWSDVYLCPHCTRDVVYWHAAVNLFACEVAESFACPHCATRLCKEAKFQTKHGAILVERCAETWFDPLLRQSVQRQKRVPVMISYEFDGARFEKWPDARDLETIELSERLTPRLVAQPMMHRGASWGDTWRAGVHTGITHAHQFFTNRTLVVLAEFIARTENHRRVWFALTATLMRGSRLNRYMPQHRDNRSREVVGPLSGTLYVPAIGLELNLLRYLPSKRKAMQRPWSVRAAGQTLVSTQSSTNLSDIPNCCVDYVFADPPFGDNLFYSELNFVWEWLIRCYSRSQHEAIVSQSGGKDLGNYTALMTKALAECYRVLKPGKWLTVEFHNSRNAVWTAIHEAIEAAGFVVADVRTLDKKKGTTKQLTFANAVKQDLIISAYKPDTVLEKRFDLEAGTENGAWEFIRSHLSQLPRFVQKDGRSQIIAERQKHLLFDRMVAFHVRRRCSVPLSAGEFYAGLHQRFPERDGMYFLPSEVNEHDIHRMDATEVEQFALFVNDEKSAIQWVRRQLTEKPRTYQDLQPLYMREAQRVWEEHEQPLELATILEQNFLADGTGKWRVPDPKSESDLEQFRHRTLLKEFAQHQESKGKLKVVRTEALRAGFKEAWQKQDYATIIQMAKRVPDAVIQEDRALLMYWRNALTRAGE